MKRLLKKYKDKLYTFLVLKNSAIASEYQSYVMADVQRHEKHKVKSWIFLIKLNIKYRLLGKKDLLSTSNINQNNPYSITMEQSESSRVKRIDIIHFLGKLVKYDVISFDIFDTLILRNVNKPVDVFILVGDKLKLMNFKSNRIKAELDARIKKMEVCGSNEITIYDIYKELLNYYHFDINEAIKVELEIEKQICIANPYMKEVFELLLEHNKKIVLTSDMYYPSTMMQELLDCCGYNNYNDLLVSCEYGEGKSNGYLFNIIKNKFRTDNIIHIGDNVRSDIDGAKYAGIDSYFYTGVHVLGNKYRVNNMEYLQNSIYSAIVNIHLYNGTYKYDGVYELGFVYGGLYVYGYCKHLYEYSISKNIDKIIFLARDGDIYYQIFQQYYGEQIQSEYMYWSRNCNIPNYAYKSKYLLFHLLRRYTERKVTIKDFLKNFDLDFLCNDNNFKFKSILEEELTEEIMETLIEYFVDNWDKIVAHYEINMDSYRDYVAHVIGKSNRILLVDVGWYGTSPIILKELIEDKWKMNVNVEISLAGKNKLAGRSMDFADINSYLFSDKFNRDHYNFHVKPIHNAYFEMFTQSKQPSFYGFINDNFVFTLPEVENYHYTDKIQEGIIDFCEKYHEATKNFTFLRNVSGYDAYCLFRFLMKKPEIIKTILGDFIQTELVSGLGPWLSSKMLKEYE